MKNIIKIAITLTAIGVAVKVVRKTQSNNNYCFLEVGKLSDEDLKRFCLGKYKHY